MDVYLPYLVLLGGAILFFVVCYAVFYKPEPKRKMPQTTENVYYNRNYYEKNKTDYGAFYYNASGQDKEEKTISTLGEEQVDRHTYAPSKEALRDTLALPKLTEEVIREEAENIERTKVISKSELLEVLAEEEKVTAMPEPKPAQDMGDDELTQMVALGTLHFRNSFGIIDDVNSERLDAITAAAIQRLGVSDLKEWKALLSNLVTQEALEYMQKAYLVMPEAWMKEVALQAFFDVVHSPKSGTPYLVSFDALHILPHLSLPHMQAMAMTLLLQYSRNTNNYSLANFQHYVQKYLRPFADDLPTEDTFFQQLKYLRCLELDKEKLTLVQLFSNSYPFVFNYRGFTEDELYRALHGENLDKKWIVPSVNSSMYKLALVDEIVAPHFFRKAGIADEETRQALLNLATSKPTAFSGRESLTILDRIDPMLVSLQTLYAQSSLGTCNLSLLGLYLAKVHVKATIGEDFDLSRWFN